MDTPNIDKLLDRCNEMDITEQINWLGDANMPFNAKKELAALKSELAELKEKNSLLEKEIKTDDDLLSERSRLLKSIPSCNAHGVECIPHAIEWVEKQKELLAEVGRVIAPFAELAVEREKSVPKFYNNETIVFGFNSANLTLGNFRFSAELAKKLEGMK